MSASDADRAAVAAAVAEAGSSFAWGMRILPKPRRDAMYAIYAFCRAADDAADDSPDEATATAALDGWRAEIDALFAGAPQTPIGRTLRVPVAQYDLQRADFDAVIDGCAMDAGPPVFAPDQATLDLYIDRVAGAVGRLSVRAFGAPDAIGPRLATTQARALQLTNILRDFAEDAARGRLYAPRERLVAAGAPIEAGAPWTTLNHPGFAAVAAAMAAEARAHYNETDALIARCPAGAARPARLMARVYRRQLDALATRGWDRAAETVGLSRGAKLRAALRGLVAL